MQEASASDLLAAITKAAKPPFLMLPYLGAFLFIVVVSLYNDAPTWVTGFIVAVGLLGAIVGTARNDRPRLTLTYELDDAARIAFDGLHAAVKAFGGADVLRVIQSKARSDWKRNAGASTVLGEQAIRPYVAALPGVSANVAIPVLPAGGRLIYLLPDHMLVTDRARYGAVQYAGLTVRSSPTQFIEAFAAPRDAKLVRTTWQYLNKNGGPDRRFKNNRQLSVYLYSEVEIDAPGLRAVFHSSAFAGAEAFVNALKAMARLPSEAANSSTR